MNIFMNKKNNFLKNKKNKNLEIFVKNFLKLIFLIFIYFPKNIEILNNYQFHIILKKICNKFFYNKKIFKISSNLLFILINNFNKQMKQNKINMKSVSYFYSIDNFEKIKFKENFEKCENLNNFLKKTRRNNKIFPIK